MYLLNLSLFQFLTVFTSISALAVALYLLDRSRRKQVVSTLRFWVAAEQPAVAARRRRINQPWSLLLQLLSMALLLLAIAQLRLGSPARAGRDHVIVLDTSSWMAARSGNRTLMETAKQRARQYLQALPARDRVMLVRADAVAAPATAFEPDHKKVEAAIQASRPGSTALQLDQALAFARHIQAQSGARVGEIAFIGSGRTAERDPGAPALPRNLRVLLVQDTIENVGLRKIGARRSASDPDVWEINAEAHNYGSKERTVTVAIDFGPPGTAGRFPAGSKPFTLPAGSAKEASFTYKTGVAGVLGITVTPHDAFAGDDHAELELPAQPLLPVTVYSDQPELLRPLLGASPRVAAVYRKPAEYQPGDQGLVILDRFAPPQRPTADSIWIDPPAQSSPVPLRKTVEQAPFQGWAAGHPASAGLRARDFKLERASVFEPAAGDETIAQVEAGPVIVARTAKPRIVVFGFHPSLTGMRYELATPLLFANLLRWAGPEIFRRSEISGASVGAVKLLMDQETPDKDIRVTAEDGSPVPFTLRDRTLNFFSGAPGSVRVVAGDREYLYSLTLPQLGEIRWEPPSDAARGIPRPSQVLDASSDVWPWLAIAGLAGLLAEWMLYGRFRRMAQNRPVLVRRAAAEAMEVRR